MDEAQGAGGNLKAVTGQETSVGANWRRCRNCERPFLARRKDQACCSPRCSDADYNRRRPVQRAPEQAGLFPAARELGAEADRRQSKADAVLERLRRGPASTLELVRVGGVRFGARVLELRRAGHRIETEHALDHAVYRLVEGGL